MTDAQVDLETRIRRLEDREELRDLIGRYSRACDDRDIEGLVETFTPDGSFGQGEGNGAVGREAIGQYYIGALSRYGLTIHIPHIQVVEELAGDDARGWVMAHAELAVGDGFVNAGIRYEDVYRRYQGRWRFASRTLKFWYFTDRDDLSGVANTPDRRTWPVTAPAELPESVPTYQAFVEKYVRASAQ